MVEERLSPFSGKLIWIVAIVAGLFFAGSIIAVFYKELGFGLLLLFLAAGAFFLRFYMKKHNRDRAARLGLREEDT